MTKALDFTAAAVTRMAKGILDAGLFIVGAKPDGTLIVGDKPFETASLVPVEPAQSPVPPTMRRFGEKLHGGQSDN